MDTNHAPGTDQFVSSLHKIESRPWLGSLPRPRWLLNDPNDDVWMVTSGRDDKKDTVLKIKWDELLYEPFCGRISRLTDPENAHLLETAQLFAIECREGHLSKGDSGKNQQRKILILLNIIGWMLLEGIRTFGDIRRSHLQDFMRAAIWGVPGILNAYQRLDGYVASLRSHGRMFPVRNYRFSHEPALPPCSKAISKDLGFDINKITNDPIWAHKMSNSARELGHRMHKKTREKWDTEEPEPNPVSADTFRHYLVVWKYLFEWRYLFPKEQQLKFDPTNGATASNYSKAFFKSIDIDIEEGRTDSIDEYHIAYLLDRSLRWVLIYADDLLDLRDEFEEIIQSERDRGKNIFRADQRSRLRFGEILHKYVPKNFVPNSSDYPAAPWPLAPVRRATMENRNEERVLGFGKAVNNFIPIACAIVIAIFCARRHDEVQSLRDDYPNAKDDAPAAIEVDAEGSWLWCYIEKTVQDWDRVPCSHSVVKAVEVLKRWSAGARKITDDRRLFRAKYIGTKEVFGVRFGDWLKQFSDYINLPPHEDGTKVVLKPHQFRRFFAMLYFWRYDQKNLCALSYFLRHSDLAMTEVYVTDIVDGAMIRSAKKKQAIALMTDLAFERRKASGEGGKILNELYSNLFGRAMKNLEIVTPEMKGKVARRVAERIMEKLDLQIVPFKWGYCTAFKKVGTFSGYCISNGANADGPDLAKAQPKICSNCAHFYTDENFRPFWENMAQIYARSISCKDLPPKMRSLTIELHQVFCKGLLTHFGIQEEGQNGGIYT